MFNLYSSNINSPNGQNNLLFRNLDDLFEYIRNEHIQSASFNFIPLGTIIRNPV